ncbi:MAG: hypothetical protein HYZ47_04860, partial [Simkania negevensis]|nr:hypothetical protein [Simkania negevensis]
MFPIELSPPKSHCDELHKELQEILKLFIQENLNFEDKHDFIDWIDGFLPDIKWQEYSKLSADLSIYFLCRFSLDARWEMHFVDFLKKWLLEYKEAISLNYQQTYFHLKGFPEVPLFISKVQIHVNNPDSLNTLKLHLLHLSKKIRTGPSCSTSFPITSLSSPDKIATVHENVKRMIHRFPHYIEPQALQELSHLLLIAGEEFVIPRTPKHVTRLTLSQHHIRKKLLKATFLYPNTRHIQIRFIAASLLSPFSSKQVLGVMLAVNLFEKYESLDEQQIILTAKKFIPEIEGVKGGTYSDLNYRERIKILYVECKKSDDSSFSLLEKSILKQGLQEELKYRIEKLVPTIFMVRNEEEVLRTILILNQEIKSLSDIPQVVISFDRQINGELIFTVILLSIRKSQAPSLTKKIDKIRKVSSFFPYRIQVVRYLEEKHPIEAHVFSIPIKKESSLLREDSSFNFYLAREKVSQIVTGAVGEFRDYNGGIIIKQKEALSQFKNLFKEFAENKKELLENFFYSLVPLEAQVTLPLASLQKFFSLFLKELSQSFAAPYSYFLNFEEEHNKTYLIISFQEESLKELVGNSLEQMNLASRNLISAFVTYQETFFLAYIFENTNKNKHEQFIEIIKKAIDTWQEKIKNLKSLKLSFQSSLLSLDPRIGGDEDSRIILKLLFEGLMRVDKKGKISNGIAQSFHISKDLRSYRFTLRESVWSNGDPLTAYDFEYAWKKTLSPNFNTPFAYLFFPIKNAKEVKEGVLPIEELGVHALNDKTLEVELSHVAPYFLELTTHTIFSPIHRKTDQDHPFWPTQTGIDYLCNGAFTLKINSQSHGYEVIKNPLYWDYEEVKIDQIIITRN